MITAANLPNVEKKAKEIFAELKKKYPSMKAYLVLSSTKGQCKLTSKIEEILDSFPKCVMDSDAKGKALDLLKQKKPLDVETLNKIQLDASVMVEFRFEELKYDIIDLLRTDPLVDGKLTPHGQRSIRIVLGSLDSLLGSGES